MSSVLFSGVLLVVCVDSPAFFAVSQAVAVSADGDGGGVMEEPIQQGGGQDGIGEEVAPCGIGFVGGEDDGFPLVVAFGDDLEEEGGVVLFKGEVADFVEEEQVGSCERVLEDMESIALFGDPRFCDEVVQGDEVDAMSGFEGFEREAHGQVGLPHAGRAQEQDILTVVEEAQTGQFIDGFLRDLWLCVKVEGLEGLGRGNARQAQVGADASLEALVAFACEQFVDDLDGRAVLLVPVFEDGIQSG